MKILIGLVVLALLLGQYGAQGGRSMIFNDMKLEEQLKILNKPTIKTFHTKEGDIFDCVDIYKQPALDHPLLKNHRIQMRPTSQPEGLVMNEPTSVALSSGVNCSQGTVPIRRTQKDVLIRVKTFVEEHLAKDIHPHATIAPNQHFVSLGAPNENATYYGAQANISVHHHLDVNKYQYTTAQMWLGGGPVDQYHTIQAGWMIGPQVSGDNLTRLFVYWSQDHTKSGCFNQLCPGFIQVHKQVTIGSVLHEGHQKQIELSVFRDRYTGHWWFQLNHTINVGYVPKTLLPHLAKGASEVSWGGLAIHPPYGLSPPMGTGFNPKSDNTRAASFEAVKVVDTTNKYVVPNQIKVHVLVESPRCYNLQFLGKQYKNSGLKFLFGGPRGDCRDSTN